MYICAFFWSMSLQFSQSFPRYTRKIWRRKTLRLSKKKMQTLIFNVVWCFISFMLHFKHVKGLERIHKRSERFWSSGIVELCLIAFAHSSTVDTIERYIRYLTLDKSSNFQTNCFLIFKMNNSNFFFFFNFALIHLPSCENQAQFFNQHLKLWCWNHLMPTQLENFTACDTWSFLNKVHVNSN